MVWLQQALRGTGNPVIEQALWHANAIRLPVLVYHGLRQDYPHASGRIHGFILRASRRLAVQCRARGIRVVQHVQRPERAEKGLVYRLAADAAALYTDEHFAFIARSQSLSVARSGVCATFAVDASRLVPTRVMAAGLASTREFRAAHGPLRARWACSPADARAMHGPYAGSLPFVPDDLADADDSSLDALKAMCHIDQSLPLSLQHPASELEVTNRLRALNGIARGYARTRNNPALPWGTSMLSPYLHFGVVSPHEVLAACRGADDAQVGWKFVDELLTWREWAHYRARTEPEIHRYSALPPEVREDLESHADDEREPLPDWHALVHGETSDIVWNAAQRQWLATGWMHNNLRMYWATQLLRMTAHPQAAWSLGCYMNDRLSLDGRDPASYASLRWAFGEGARGGRRPVYGRAPRKGTCALMRRDGVPGWIEQANRVAVPRIDCSDLPSALSMYA